MKRNIIVLLVTAAILTACSGTAEPQQGTLISANEISLSKNNFSEEDISNSQKILISYEESNDKEKRVLSKIFLIKGNMQEYAILENGETFHVFRDGSWRYSSGVIRIFYLEEKKHHVFSITGAEENITRANLSEIFSRVKKKISELWKFVN